MAESKPAQALTLIEPVTLDTAHTDLATIWTVAKLQVNDLPAAAKGLEFLITDARVGLSATTPWALATLARIQVELGQKDEGRQTYQKFFELWKDADADVPLLVKAREEIARLR